MPPGVYSPFKRAPSQIFADGDQTPPLDPEFTRAPLALPYLPALPCLTLPCNLACPLPWPHPAPIFQPAMLRALPAHCPPPALPPVVAFPLM